MLADDYIAQKAARNEEKLIRLRPFKLSDTDYLLKWIGNEYAFAQWSANNIP